MALFSGLYARVLLAVMIQLSVQLPDALHLQGLCQKNFQYSGKDLAEETRVMVQKYLSLQPEIWLHKKKQHMQLENEKEKEEVTEETAEFERELRLFHAKMQQVQQALVVTNQQLKKDNANVDALNKKRDLDEALDQMTAIVENLTKKLTLAEKLISHKTKVELKKEKDERCKALMKDITRDNFTVQAVKGDGNCQFRSFYRAKEGLHGEFFYPGSPRGKLSEMREEIAKKAPEYFKEVYGYPDSKTWRCLEDSLLNPFLEVVNGGIGKDKTGVSGEYWGYQITLAVLAYTYHERVKLYDFVSGRVTPFNYDDPDAKDKEPLRIVLDGNHYYYYAKTK